MKIEENQETSGSEIQVAESNLEKALSQIKGRIPEEPKVETTYEVKEEKEEPKRETLKLPEKKEEIRESKFVETDEPEVQRRINELYRESKTNAERATLLQDELIRIAGRAEEREAFLVTELQKIQNRYTQQDDEAALSDLRKQFNEAIQNLDYDNAGKINEKIIDFKTEQNINKLLKSKNSVENNQRQIRQPGAYSNDNPVDVAELNLLTSQKNEDGSVAKPWLVGTHPRSQEFTLTAGTIANRYLAKGIRPSLSTLISETEKVMGLGNQKGTSQGQSPNLKHPTVLSSNATLNASSDNQANKLSDLEKSYAAKLGVDEKNYARLRKIGSSGPISMDNFKK